MLTIKLVACGFGDGSNVLVDVVKRMASLVVLCEVILQLEQVTIKFEERSKGWQ